MNNHSNSQDYNSALATITSLFFMWGFMTVMNDVLIPHLKKIFELDYFKSMLVQTSFFGAYFIGSLIYYIVSSRTGDPINKIGYKKGIIIGILVSALGSALFYPAAFINVYGFYLLALFILGLGFTILQIAANPYVAILGNPETASSRLNLAQGFNSLGTMLGPLIGGALIFRYFAGTEAVKVPYLVLAGVLIILAFVINKSELPAFINTENIEKGKGALNYPHLVLGMIAIFMYVGGEVSIGSILINFFGEPDIMGMDETNASRFLSLYWGGLMIGRFSGAIYLSSISNLFKKFGYMVIASVIAFMVIYISNNIKNEMSIEVILPLLIFIGIAFILFVFGKSIPSRTLYLFASIVILLLIATIFFGGEIAFWAVIGIGLFNSIMWSNIFSLAIDGLGKYTSQGSSLLVMAILGGAVIPPIQGLAADFFSVQTSFAVPIICYFYIMFYGAYGYKLGK